jgi:hypothetical protein
VNTSLSDLLAELSDESLVLDVGGWAAPHPRADWVIDLGPYETRHYYERVQGIEPVHPERFTRDTWVQHDICAPGPWPLDDGMFDVVVCIQTLEDVRDPIKVCAEMERVGRAGYIETPGAAIEVTRGVESPLWCGWRHHRWLVFGDDGGLVFFAKPHSIHHALWPAVRSPRRLRPEAARNVEFAWRDALPAREEIEHDADKVDRRLRQLASASSRADPVGSLRRGARETAWNAYRSARAGIRSLLSG